VVSSSGYSGQTHEERAKIMWLVVHKGTQIVVSSSSNRAGAYDTLRSLKSLTTEKYRVERV